MTLLRPSAVVTLDGRRLTSAEGALTRVRVRLGMGAAHDHAECYCWPSSKLQSVSAGARLVVALGPSQDERDVFTGEVAGARRTPDGLVLEAVAASFALSRSFVSQTFLDLSIAEIVRQLLSSGGAEASDVSAEVTFSAYAVDNRRSVWSHLNELARIAGADLSVTASGTIRFVVPKPKPDSPAAGLLDQASTSLGGGNAGPRYGASVLSWRVTERQAAPTAGVAAYGSASESGAEKWHWIRRDPEAIGEGPARIVPAFRTRDGAKALSDALAAQSARSVRQTKVVVIGDATLRPGQTTAIPDIPHDPGGDLRILGVEHRLGREGFTSSLTLEVAA